MKQYFSHVLAIMLGIFLMLAAAGAVYAKDAVTKNTTSAEATTISLREDENYYYSELNFFGPNKEDIAVAVNEGVLTFSVSSVKASGKKVGAGFRYSVSVPEYDSSKAIEIMRQDRKITVKLSKKID